MKFKLISILAMLGFLSIALTIGYITAHSSSSQLRHPFRQPPSSPTINRVAGAGVVESASRNTEIGAFTAGIILEIPVQPGQMVKQGETLMKLDARDAEAMVAVQQAALDVAQQQLAELKLLPRPEDVPIAEAKVKAAEALAQQQVRRLERGQQLRESNSISAEDLDAIVEAELVAREDLASTQAELAKLMAGAWAPQIATAQAQVTQASAMLAQAKTAVALRTVTAPTDGQVLQINVRAGEFVSGTGNKVLMVFGDTRRLNVRVDIDEVDIPRFEQAKTATAYRRGDAATAIPLKLLRIEPLVIPKQTLTGEFQERTDTRVLQAVFEVDSTQKLPPLYVGQQLDVFAETKLPPLGIKEDNHDG